MNTLYLNNITEEALSYYRKVTLMPDGTRSNKVKSARLKHLVKLVKYRDRAYNGGLDDNRFCESDSNFLPCQGVDGPCGKPAKKRRQNTAYVDDEMNWVVMCDECAEYNDQMWQEMWNEYYSGRL